MSDRGFSVSLISASRTDLTKREQVMLKDTSDAMRLDQATADGAIVINVDMYAELEVHNERSRDGNKTYPNFVIIDKDGTKYVTGSENFWNSFLDIMADMAGEPEVLVKVFRRPSKNYAGKSFLTCALV